MFLGEIIAVVNKKVTTKDTDSRANLEVPISVKAGGCRANILQRFTLVKRQFLSSQHFGKRVPAVIRQMHLYYLHRVVLQVKMQDKRAAFAVNRIAVVPQAVKPQDLSVEREEFLALVVGNFEGNFVFCCLSSHEIGVFWNHLSSSLRHSLGSEKITRECVAVDNLHRTPVHIKFQSDLKILPSHVIRSTRAAGTSFGYAVSLKKCALRNSTIFLLDLANTDRVVHQKVTNVELPNSVAFCGNFGHVLFGECVKLENFSVE
mmetsp:Transcript_69451/g.112713  ORF Transcript_69451/g.112713 Transcript_69451/m.112713 type:complete len:261 (+) Transcript_69451:298-1080(+)